MADNFEYPVITNRDLNNTTREQWLDGVIDLVLFKMVLYARVIMQNRVTFRGGEYITRPVKVKHGDDLSQDYLVDESLSVGRRSRTERPRFGWKLNQTPVMYDVEEWLKNSGGGDTAPVDLVDFLVDCTNEDARIHHYKSLWSFSSSENSPSFQSIPQALYHGDTAGDIGYLYGGLTRDLSANNNTAWQSADINDFSGGTSSQATLIDASMDTIEKMYTACNYYVKSPASNFMFVCGPVIYHKLKAWVRAHKMDTGKGMMAKYGFTSFTVDEYEIVLDDFLRAANDAAVGGATGNFTTLDKVLFCLYMPDFELRLHPQRAFEFTGFTHQAMQPDGYDMWLARIFAAGNFINWRPNASCMQLNVV